MLSVLISALSTLADVKQSAHLSPQDIGAFKWIVGATAKEGEVVILRYSRTWTTPEGMKHIDTHDIVSYGSGKRDEGSFVAINPDYFNVGKEGDPTWHIQNFGGSCWCPGKYSGSSTGGERGSIKFTTSEGHVREYVFFALVMPYEEASKLYSNGLPKKSQSSWVWGGSPIPPKQTADKKSEQVVPEQSARSTGVKKLNENFNH